MTERFKDENAEFDSVEDLGLRTNVSFINSMSESSCREMHPYPCWSDSLESNWDEIRNKNFEI